MDTLLRLLYLFILTFIIFQRSAASFVVVEDEQDVQVTNPFPTVGGGDRIFGGNEVPSGTYEWFARATGPFGGWWGCGGSLVTPEFILTAAHCDFSKSVVWTVGALCYPYTETENCDQEVNTIGTKEVFNHPSHTFPVAQSNDFALVQLSAQSTIQPVQMDQRDISPTYTGGEKVWVAGFGLTETGAASYNLHHVEVSVIDNDVCSSPDVYGWLIDESMMCAADPDQDACTGDSGGPLYDKDNDRLVGIVSWGYQCALPSFPGVYSRVSSEWEWIQNTICDNHSLENYPDFCGTHSPTKSSAPSISNYPTEAPTIQRLQSTVISNGVIMLGIHEEGRLNALDESNVYPEAYLGIDTVGLRFFRDGGWYDSIAYGTPSEGYGVSAKQLSSGEQIYGGANKYGGLFNNFGISSPFLSSDGVSATSTVIIGDTLSITHEFKPSPVSENLYQIKITVENLLMDESLSELRYRRVMDWDITPNLFAECVHISYDSFPSSLEYLTDDGFETMNPLVDVSSSGIVFSCKEEGIGGCNIMYDGASDPVDRGSLFQFLFKNEDGSLLELGPKETFSFDFFYGATATKEEAYRIISAANIDIVSIAYPPTDSGCSTLDSGSPNVFIAGYRGAEKDVTTTTPPITVSSTCINDPLFTFKGGAKKCNSIYFVAPSTKAKLCSKPSIFQACKAACDACCGNNDMFSFKDGRKNCVGLILEPEPKRLKFCKWENVNRNCPQACKVCSSGDEAPPSFKCVDDPSFTFSTYTGATRLCGSIYYVDPLTKDRFCSQASVKAACPIACNLCCGNNIKFKFKINETCESLEEMEESKRSKFCEWATVKNNCRKSCGIC